MVIVDVGSDILVPMGTVELALPTHRYEVAIAPGLLQSLGEQVRRVAPHQRAAIIVDRTVADGYGRIAQRSMAAAGYDPLVEVVPSGERYKTLDTVRSLYGALVGGALERRSPVVALGGGVVGDLAVAGGLAIRGGHAEPG